MKVKVANTYQVTLLVESETKPKVEIDNYTSIASLTLSGKEVNIVEFSLNPVDVIEMTIAPEETTNV